ncbi:MAG: hypothetical protein V7K94_23970 [Nostoc sp.]|uniref:hypothetical protein n=1 Tax=Nostoc sp. TaxID=1180 RepID=UPI002FF75C83
MRSSLPSDRSLLPLCSLRLERFVKKSVGVRVASRREGIAKTPQCVGKARRRHRTIPQNN